MPPICAADAGSSAAAGAAAAAPLDEEGFGKAGAPEEAGIPRDPANAASKLRSLRAMIAMGFALAIGKWWAGGMAL